MIAKTRGSLLKYPTQECVLIIISNLLNMFVSFHICLKGFVLTFRSQLLFFFHIYITVP